MREIAMTIQENGGDVAELVDARDLKSRTFSKVYEFESHHPHHRKGLKIPRQLNPHLQVIQNILVVHSLDSALFIYPQQSSSASHPGYCRKTWQAKSISQPESVSFLQYPPVINRLNAKQEDQL
jgi:hypothetical protein